MADKLWLLQINSSQASYDRLLGLIAQHAPYGWEEAEQDASGVIFRVYGRDEAQLASLGNLTQASEPGTEFSIHEVESKDWNSAWREFFTPVFCGRRFVVVPPWLAAREYAGRETIVIDPKNAFGTGHHASTALCLAALSDLLDAGALRRGGWFLDIGCGSGILGIAAEKAGMSGTALDTDLEAVANARENRELNEADSMEILLGSLEKVKGDRFDLIMANILAQPLIEMAADIVALLKKEGALILSGILKTQAEKVAAAYEGMGLGKPGLREEGEWAALVWR